MLQILLVDVDDRTRQLLAGIEDVELVTDPQGPADVAIIGPDVQAPIQAAQRLQRSGDIGSMVFFSDEAGRAGIQHAIEATPLLADRATVVDSADPQEALERTIARARRQQRGRAMANFARASLGGRGGQADQIVDRILDHAPVGVAVTDTAGLVAAWNLHAGRLTGRAERGVLGKPLAKALGAAEVHDGTIQAETQEGATIQVDVVEASVDDGRIVVFQDVTARVQAEAQLAQTLTDLERLVEERTGALRESEAKYRHLVETSQDLIWAVDAGGVITFASDQACQAIYGQPEDRLRGNPLWGLAKEDDRERDARFIQRVLAGEAVMGHESWHQGDGREVLLSWNATPTRTGGEVTGATGTARDMTTRVEAERERRVAEEKRREVEDLRQMEVFRTAFINAAAHELRTPLTPLAVQIRLLRSDGYADVPAQVRSALDLIERNVDRFRRLVNDLLEASRFQGGRLRIKPEEIDLADFTMKVVEDYVPAIKDAGIQLDVDLTPPLRVRADPDRLRQILQNLLNNAIRFTPAGGNIRVTGRHAQHDAVVEVADTGIGMTQEQQGQLFQPFTQLHDDTEKQRRGTGLGLYLSRSLAELHHGSLTGSSDGPGNGSMFRLSLPLRL